ncbi:MAG: hypothetical protein KY455_06935 [Euryarchaeota archaeon]|nr:hypothetical protein [Euryarchaeota archaeon]
MVRRLPATLLVTLITLMLLVPATSAHPARDPCDWEQRLIHDHKDDLSGSAVEKKHGHELHALDLVEAWDEELGDVLAFRLLYEGGYAPDQLVGGDPKPDKLRDVLTFKADGDTHTFEWTTTDNKAFSGTFDKIVQPKELTKACDSTQKDEGHLGQRYVVEGWVAFEEHGLAKGMTIKDHKVDGYADSTKADTMDGSARTNEDDASFHLAAYEIGARPKIIDLALDWKTVDMKVGENKTVVATVTNRLDKDQAARVVYDGPAMAGGVFHLNDEIGYERGEMAFPMASGKGAENSIHLYLVPEEPLSDKTVTVHLYGDMGDYTGHVTKSLTLTATAPVQETPPTGPSGTQEETTTPVMDDDGPAEESPVVAFMPLLFMALAALALARKKDGA